MGHALSVDVMAQLPSGLADVVFNSRMTPGRRPEACLAAGRNCQRFAYAVLDRVGRGVPPLRSSELWNDTQFTERVECPQTLDLALFGPTHDPWGAHVGVVINVNSVLHLGEDGKPAVWTFEEFAHRYRTCLGFERVAAAGEVKG